MRRSIRATVLALGATLAIAGGVSAQPISEPASCAGYLASYANPNNAFIIHEIVMPIADSLGVTVGQVDTDRAARRPKRLDRRPDMTLDGVSGDVDARRLKKAAQMERLAAAISG